MHRTGLRALFVVFSLGPVLGLVACDKGTPLAPQGAVLQASANPTEIPVTGTSTLTLSLTRSNGVPVNPGTEIQLITDLGSVPPIVTTDERGLAHAVYSATGRAGTATIRASSGAAPSVDVAVDVGFLPGAVTIQPNPTRLPSSGGTVNLRVTVLDDHGLPLVNASVILNTSGGSLAAGGTLQRTNFNGVVTDTLQLTSSQARAQNGTPVLVAAVVSSGGLQVSSTLSIPVAAPPP